LNDAIKEPGELVKPFGRQIAALKQHQDPASDGASATNKAITLELAKQIKNSLQHESAS